MNCKNCDSNLRTDFAYCPTCGARVVQKRLTFKSLAADVYERVFNIDNTIFRTIRDLTLRPGRVINAYVTGIRRKYMNPLNYLGLAIFISGALFFVMRKFAMDKINFDVFGTGMTNAASVKIMDAVMEYSSFVFLLYIPIIGCSGYLTLNRQNYNLPEYMVASSYALAHISILTFLPSLLIMLFLPENYMQYSLVMMLFMFGYSLYAFLRLGTYSLASGLGRSIIFLLLFFIGYMGLSRGLNLIFLLTGEVSLEDFRPIKN